MNLYNEIDPYAAAWLGNLIDAGHIPAGRVETRSITDLQPSDLHGYQQCHFFAGIAGWSLALELAGWPAGRSIWTGSCPCQPFSAAGKGLGTADHRHLWPEFLRLIAECRPATVVGEQVASAAGRAWLASVRADLEALGYAVGAADLCAAGVGAPHIRQRLFWVADATRGGQRIDGSAPWRAGHADECQPVGGVGHTHLGRCEGPLVSVRQPRQDAASPEQSGPGGGLANAHGGQPGDRGLQPGGQHGQQSPNGGAGGVGDADDQGLERRRNEHGECFGERAPGAASPWHRLQWLPCADGKARPTQPGLFPLAHGVPARVGKLRAYGNAIVPDLAAQFIRAFLDAEVIA